MASLKQEWAQVAEMMDIFSYRNVSKCLKSEGKPEGLIPGEPAGVQYGTAPTWIPLWQEWYPGVRLSHVSRAPVIHTLPRRSSTFLIWSLRGVMGGAGQVEDECTWHFQELWGWGVPRETNTRYCISGDSCKKFQGSQKMSDLTAWGNVFWVGRWELKGVRLTTRPNILPSNRTIFPLYGTLLRAIFNLLSLMNF